MENIVGLSLRDDHAGRRGGVGSLQETHAERPAWRPSGARLEGGEDIFGGVKAFLLDGEDADDDCYRAGKCPEDGSGLDFEANKQLFTHILLLIQECSRAAKGG